MVAQINALLTKSISKPTSRQKNLSRVQNVNMVLNALVKRIAVKRSHVQTMLIITFKYFVVSCNIDFFVYIVSITGLVLSQS